jgi:Na+/H+ antiporter NhaA
MLPSIAYLMHHLAYILFHHALCRYEYYFIEAFGFSLKELFCTVSKTQLHWINEGSVFFFFVRVTTDRELICK